MLNGTKTKTLIKIAWRQMRLRTKRFTPQVQEMYFKLIVNLAQCFFKTVLIRIISIVRVTSLCPNRDNSDNRDDETKRSPLNVKLVAYYVFTTSGWRRLMNVPFLSFRGTGGGDRNLSGCFELNININTKPVADKWMKFFE